MWNVGAAGRMVAGKWVIIDGRLRRDVERFADGARTARSRDGQGKGIVACSSVGMLN